MLIRVSARDFAVLQFHIERGWDFASRRLRAPFPGSGRINRIGGEHRGCRGDCKQRTNDLASFHGAELFGECALGSPNLGLLTCSSNTLTPTCEAASRESAGT